MSKAESRSGNSGEDDRDHVKYAHDREWVRRKMEHEDHLVDSRMSWLMASQAFLVAAYGLQFTATNPRAVPMAFRLAVAFGGLASAALTYLSILAGVMAHRRTCKGYVGNDEDRRAEIKAGTPATDRMGFIPSVSLAPVCCAGWIVALIYNFL